MRNYSLENDVEIMEKLGVGPYQLFLLKTLYEAEENRVSIYKSISKMKKMGLLDLDALANYTLGDYREKATNSERENFNKLFRDSLTCLASRLS